MSELVLNNVLCFISSARASAPANDIISKAHAFYESAQIITAKDLIFRLINENVVRRKSDDKYIRELKDILDAFNKAEEKSISLPTFVAMGAAALPPSSGFEVIVDIINDLKKEISDLKNKITSFDKVHAELGQIKKQMADMNKQVRNVNSIPSTASNQINQKLQAARNATGYSSAAKNSQASRHVTNPPGQSVVPINDSRHGTHRSPTLDHALPNNSDNVQNDPRMLPNSQWRNTGSIPTRTEASPDNQTGTNDWQVYHSRRTRRNLRRPKIMGTRNNSSTLVAYERYYDLFVGGLNEGTTTEILKNYCENELNVRVKACNPLETSTETYKCFKVTMNLTDRNICLDGSCWPINVMVKKFYSTNRYHNAS